MSMFGDYKSYKLYEPQYAEWKSARDLAEAKRQEYLKQNPNEFNSKDIQTSKTILRAIDVMDEYSQKRAEDMEIATDSVVSAGLELALGFGAAIGFFITKIPSVKNLLSKFAKNNKKMENAIGITAMGVGGILATVSAFPLFAWAAKAEVKASRKGRFEAMRKELNDTKTFAVLTPEQEIQLNKNLSILSQQKEKKNPFRGIKENWETLKEMSTDSPVYLAQRAEFENHLEQDLKHFDEKLAPKEIENAKRDQQLLTKLVEKIDIASQDYAENAELATSALITSGFALSGLFTFAYEKLAQKFKWKQTSVPAGIGMLAMLGASIFGATIQKQAARVGRFKVKQELMNNPEQLIYVSDEKTGTITDVQIKPQEKLNIIKFLKEAWKNNKEFEKWKKSTGKKEKKLSKAMENIELSNEQMKEARRLQHNTFKTFNKVDEKSQKYAESIEALGQAIQYPLGLIFSGLGLVFGMKYLEKAIKQMDKGKIDKALLANAYMKYFGVIFLTTIPSILINAYILEYNVFADPYISKLFGEIETAIRSAGFYTIVQTVDNIKDAATLLRNWNVDGAVFLTSQNEKDMVFLHKQDICPMVFLDSYSKKYHDFLSVNIDDYKGGYIAT
ncbi:MAG: LacI family transcriptional regulator, partial [Spirochaetaceae bacterium]|nr:LacI family transcriptional regulator [Spirochaetaceae bacterium]